MKIFRLILLCAAFFFLKESAIAQPEDSFKNISFKNENIFRDSTGKIDSARVKNRKFWAEFWEDYAPSIAVGGGFHSDMISETGEITFANGLGWNAVVNFPFDKSHIVNLEFSFHMMYGKDSLNQTFALYGGNPLGMRFYFTERNTAFRPFLNVGLSYIGYFFFHINNGGGVDYTINSSLAAQLSVQRLYSYRKETFGNGTFAKPYTSYAGFLGVRYQL